MRQRNFRLFWIGETVNQLGSAMALIGVPLLAVLFLHATTFEVGVLAAAAYLPWLVIGLPAGAWVDRLPPRPVMIACDVASAILYASVPVAYAIGVLTIGQLLAVQLLAGAAAVVFGTAYQVNLPSLITSAELAEGNTKLQASTSAASLGGRGLSGVVTQLVGATAALVFNAASFAVSAACLLAIRAPEPRPVSPRQVTALRRDVAEGMALVFRDPYLRPLTLFGGVANFALDALAALVVVFLIRVVGLGAGLTGLLAALPGVGGLLAAFVARPVIATIGSARGLVLATIGGLPFALLIPLAGHGPRLVFYVAGTLIAATGVTIGNIITATFRQAYCPPGMLGRVTATMRFVTMGTSPFGALAGGALGTWLGPRDALWIVLSILAISGTPLLGPGFTRHRDLPAAPAASAPTRRYTYTTAIYRYMLRRCTDMGGEPVKMTIYLPDALAAEVKAGLTDTNISAVCQAALRAELEREKAMEKIDAGEYRRVRLYDGKREHDIAFQGRKIGSSKKADAWLTPKGTIAVYDRREQELYTYDEYDAFADDEGVDERLRADVAEALGKKYVEELDI